MVKVPTPHSKKEKYKFSPKSALQSSQNKKSLKNKTKQKTTYSNPKRGRFLPLRVNWPIRIQVSGAPQTNSFFEASHWQKSAGIISLDLFLKDSLEQREGRLHTIGPQCPLLENPKPDPDAG